MTALSDQRIDCITGSRIGAIVGDDPNRSRAAVKREMVRQHFGAPGEYVDDPATAWGRAHEHIALVRYELEHGVELYGKQLFIRHPEYTFLGVTVDGLTTSLDDGRGVVEVKCPWRASYTSIDQCPHYLEQGSLQVECTQRQWVDYCIWRPNGMTIERKEYDPTWLERHMDKLVEFMTEFRETVADPELAAPYLAPKLDIRTDARWIELATEAQELLGDKERLDARLGEIKKEMAGMAGLSSAKGGGIHLVRVEKKGSVSYKKVLEEYAPDADLEPYRGDGSIEWQLRRAKES